MVMLMRKYRAGRRIVEAIQYHPGLNLPGVIDRDGFNPPRGSIRVPRSGKSIGFLVDDGDYLSLAPDLQTWVITPRLVFEALYEPVDDGEPNGGDGDAHQA